MPPFRRFRPSRLLCCFVLATFALAGLVACGDDDDGGALPTGSVTASEPAVSPSPGDRTPEPTPSPTATPGPSPTPVPYPSVPGLYPPNVATGNDGLDTVIRALLARNRGTLLGLALLTEVPCTTGAGQQPAKPRCPAGTADGTPVRVLADAVCPGAVLPQPGLEAALGDLLGAQQPYIHSVHIADAGTRPTYGVVLGPENPYAVLVREGRIVGLRLRCGDPNRFPAMPLPPDPEFLLPPLGLHPPETRTGIEEVDAVIAALINADPEALVALLRYSAVACVPEHEGIGSRPVCADDEPPNTLVEVLPGSVCEGYYTRPAEAEAQVRALAEEWRQLYAVVLNPEPNPESPFERHTYNVIFATAAYDPFLLELGAGDGGITRISYNCGIPPVPEDPGLIVLPPVEE